MKVTDAHPRDGQRRESNSAREGCGAKAEQKLPNICLDSHNHHRASYVLADVEKIKIVVDC